MVALPTPAGRAMRSMDSSASGTPSSSSFITPSTMARSAVSLRGRPPTGAPGSASLSARLTDVRPFVVPAGPMVPCVRHRRTDRKILFRRCHQLLLLLARLTVRGLAGQEQERHERAEQRDDGAAQGGDVHGVQ